MKPVTHHMARGRRRIGPLVALALGAVLGGCGTRGDTEEASAMGQPEPAAAVVAAMPDRVGDWRLDQHERTFDPDTLFEYINGAAELYRAFDVRLVRAPVYVREGDVGLADIQVDIFRMPSPAEAYGVFAHETRHGEDAGIGVDCESYPGVLFFWNGPYYVSISAFEQSAAAAGAVLEIGRAIDAAIGEPSSRPDLLRLLPEQNRLSAHPHFFRTMTLFNEYYFLADENILNLGDRTEATIAFYDPAGAADSGEPIVLAVISYMDGAAAAAAKEDFFGAYLPEVGEEETAARIEDGTWVGVRRIGRVLALVFQAPEREDFEQLADTVAELAAGQAR